MWCCSGQQGCSCSAGVGLLNDHIARSWRIYSLLWFQSDLSRLSEIDKSLAVFCMATYGEGDPTDNAQDFYDWLQEADADLSGLRFAVSGLIPVYAVFGQESQKPSIVLARGLGKNTTGCLCLLLSSSPSCTDICKHISKCFKCSCQGALSTA